MGFRVQTISILFVLDIVNYRHASDRSTVDQNLVILMLYIKFYFMLVEFLRASQIYLPWRLSLVVHILVFQEVQLSAVYYVIILH